MILSSCLWDFLFSESIFHQLSGSTFIFVKNTHQKAANLNFLPNFTCGTDTCLVPWREIYQDIRKKPLKTITKSLNELINTLEKSTFFSYQHLESLDRPAGIECKSKQSLESATVSFQYPDILMICSHRCPTKIPVKRDRGSGPPQFWLT